MPETMTTFTRFSCRAILQENLVEADGGDDEEPKCKRRRGMMIYLSLGYLPEGSPKLTRRKSHKSPAQDKGMTRTEVQCETGEEDN